MPVGSRRRLEPPQNTPRRIRRHGRIIEQSALPADATGQRAKERHIVLATKEEDRFGIFRRQSAFVTIDIVPLAPFKPLLRFHCAESDIVVGRQKRTRNQAPACREYVGVFNTDLANDPPVGRIRVKLGGTPQAKRIIPGCRIVAGEHVPPGSTLIGSVIRPRIDRVVTGWGRLRIGDKQYVFAVPRPQTPRIRALARGALDHDIQRAIPAAVTRLSIRARKPGS